MAKIVCPIFGVETRVYGCLRLEYHHTRGEDVEKRQGCRVCLNAGLCPVRHMINHIWNKDLNAFYSAEPKVRALPKEVVDKIRPIIAIEAHWRGLNPTPKELELIRGASGLSGKLHAPGGYVEELEMPVVKTRKSVSRGATTPAPAEISTATEPAVHAPSMADVVNKMMESEV